MSAFGPLESATRTTISELGVIDGINRPLAELCIALSQRMDAGAKGMAASAIARELRETLKSMMEVNDNGNAIDDLLERLSGPVPTPIRDTKKSRPANTRA